MKHLPDGISVDKAWFDTSFLDAFLFGVFSFDALFFKLLVIFLNPKIEFLFLRLQILFHRLVLRQHGLMRTFTVGEFSLQFVNILVLSISCFRSLILCCCQSLFSRIWFFSIQNLLVFLLPFLHFLLGTIPCLKGFPVSLLLTLLLRDEVDGKCFLFS